MKYIFAFLLFCFLGVTGYLLYLYNEIRFEVDKVLYYNPQETTQIFDTKGRLVANLFDKEFRFFVNYEEIPPKVVETLIAAEDTMFFEHFGINLDAIFRAIIKDIKLGRLAEGASTITQQLIKNVSLTREKKIVRKIKEILLAIKLETILSKEEILERYLNEIYMGHGYYGIKAASYGYFKKELKNLTPKEIAMLIALPRAPSFYDPTKNLEYTLSRANKILYRMKSIGWIEESEYQKAIKETPIVYDETLTQNIAPYVVDEVIKELKDKIEDLRSGGYKIYLNIDLDIQKLARESLQYGFESIRSKDENNESTKELNGAIVVTKIGSGEVLALVGGVDYKKSAFNRATQSKRQPGSSFKPFIYLSALNMGYSPYSRIPNISRTYEYTLEDEEKTWQPSNYTKNFGGLITLKEAITSSVNLATINLVEKIGFENVYDAIKLYGFQNLPHNLSISLGSFGISPLELATQYSIISNYGEKVESKIIDKIVTKDGKTIDFIPKRERIVEERQVYLMIDMMKNVVENGSGKNAKVEGLELAGKTGTTNDNIDAWFCGFSPEYQTIIWFGNDDNSKMSRRETGGGAAAPVFGYMYKTLLERNPQTKREFYVPKGVEKRVIDGKEILFTDISQPPKNSIKSEGEEKLIF